MKRHTTLRHTVSGTMIGLVAFIGFAAPASSSCRTDDMWLRQTLIAREAALSRAYNTCNLHALRASVFSGTTIETPDGGRIEPVFEARDRICGHLHRQVIPGSLSVRAVGDDSALVTGIQRFCAFETKPCAAQGRKFAQLWTLGQGRWRMGWMRRYADSN